MGLLLILAENQPMESIYQCVSRFVESCSALMCRGFWVLGGA